MSETFETSAVSTNEQHEPTTGSELGSNKTLDEDQRNRRPPLGVKLTGYRLLNMIVILVFGIWKAVASYRGESIISTTLDWVGGTLMAFTLYYAGLFQEERPLIFPRFFQVDWAPHILKFVWRSEVYISLLSLLPLWKAAAHLQYILDIRRSANPGDQVIDSFPILKDALAIAILELTLGFIGILRSVVNVLRYPQGEH
ncbi:hypothetical protein BJV74DRAFT_885551 [Russula compacta]|nr:hypothetical protein BJV74DRAFT_885551 [Russula compacta]